MIAEEQLLSELKHGNKKAFSFLFQKYYKDLVLFGGNYLRDKSRCEDIVQSIFLKLWGDRENLIIETSLKSFLLKSVKNGCLDELRHTEIVHKHETYVEIFGDMNGIETSHYILYSELKVHLNEALDRLPDLYREVFEMNRFEGLKYRQIAEKLEVSERTVEVRVGKALGLLREYLSDFLVTLLLFIFF